MIKKSARYTVGVWVPASITLSINRANNGYEIEASHAEDPAQAEDMIRRFAENILREIAPVQGSDSTGAA